MRSSLQSHLPGFEGSLVRLAASFLFRDPAQGAQTVVYCAVVPDKTAVDQLCGKLVMNCRAVDVLPVARSYGDAQRLWDVSTRICGLSDAGTMATEPAAVTADS